MHKSRLVPISFVFSLTCSLLSLPAHAETQNGFTPYASLRMQAETVRPDKSSSFDRYESLRDAYSRIGLKGHYNVNKTTALFGQIEVPVDAANVSFHDPYDQVGNAQRLRLAYVGVSGNLGTLTVGQQWLPYYNAIAAPVDMFSSYYSGFATYTAFRARGTLAYASQNWNGLSFQAAYITSDGNLHSTSRINDRRMQATAKYTRGNTTVALGLDDRSHINGKKDRIYGASLSHRVGDWYFGAKYERFDTDNDTADSFSADGNQAVNLFASYNFGKNTAKVMLANVDNYGGNIIHLGLDHQFSKKLKLFVEYYDEESTAAITKARGGMANYDDSISGGKALMVGFRYDIQ